MGHHTKFFWQGCSSTEKPVVMPKGCQSMGFAEKTLSGRRQKIKCRDRCLWDPSNKTPETLFTLGDLPEAKGSRSGAYSPHTLEVEGEQSRAILWGWNIWPHHLSCPSVPLRDSILTGEFGLCIPGCSGLDLQIQQLNPIKVLSLGPPPLPISTHVTKLLRMQEAHFRNQWLAQKWNDRCTGQPKKNYTDLGDVHFSPKMALSAHSVCGYNSPTCAHQLQTKSLGMLQKGLTSSLILVSPCWEMTQKPVHHILKYGHNTGTPKGTCATKEGLLTPISWETKA